QSGAPWGARTPAAAHSPASQRQSNRALWATKIPSSSTRPRPGATSAKRGQPATIWSVIPVSRATAAGTGMPGSSRASYARWTVPPSSIATAASSGRPAGGALPVASTSTTAKRQSASGRGGGTALEVIPAQRQRHAARTAATADQLAPLDGDHGPLPVPQGLRPVEQVRGRDCLEPRVLELAQGGLVAGVGDHHARPHGDEVAGRRPLLPLLEGAIGPAAEHWLERLIHRLEGGEKVRHLFHALRFLAPVQHREPLRSHKMRWIDAAQLAIELREDHVQVNRGALVGEHHDDHVLHAAMLEHQVAQVVEGGGAGALAEAEQQQIGTQGMHIPALQRVVVALFLGAVVQNAGVVEARVIAEQRLDEQLLGPAHAVAHRADDRVLPDHDAHVAREE